MNKLERKFGRYAIPNLMYYIVILYAVGVLVQMMAPAFYIQYLMLDARAILHGQIWRIMGVIGHVLAALLIYIITGQVYILTTDYLNFSLFFAFAATFPEMQFYLFFVLPIKAKYLALFDGLYFVYGFLFGGMSQRIAIVMSLLNFIVYLFMSRGSRLNPKEIRRKQVFHSQMREAQKTAEKIGRHRCAVCGRTEEDDPNLVFRYCSKCEGDYEYCQDHLYTHKHVTKGGMDPRQANSNQEA